ncbi:MAG: SDR family NAD(P)-dependent oxidoreductase [Sphingomonadales bacterium]|nr:SDR family NAD(P)-dependent oxidoreductase [Sphingomonadales bacterium]
MTDTAFTHRYGPLALVTGASSGIGTGFAEELAARGMDLVVTARRTDRLEALAARLAAEHGITVECLSADLTGPAAPGELLATLAGRDVGLLVSNAGFGLKGPHEANDAAAMAEMLTVNCHAPMQLAHGMIPRLKARGRGGLLFTASVEGLIGCPYSAAYAASKALVVSLGEALWGELSPEGIDVLTLCPGPTESEAAAKQGIDMSANPHLLPAREVARLALDNLANGPTFVSHPVYEAMFDKMRALPRREALSAMAQGMKRQG